MNPKTIGEHLKKRRLKLGLEQFQMAEMVGVTWLSISNWERGIYRPSKRTMPSLVTLLGYDPRIEET